MKISCRLLIPVLLLVCCQLPTTASALGILAPVEPGVPALQLTSQQVEVSISAQTVKTKLTQVFHNDFWRQIEGNYLFPVPKGAQVTDFVLYINGKPQHAEVLTHDKAQQIYQDIVSRLRDPGLLEYMDQDLYRVRVFPIPAHGDQKVEIEYAQVLPLDHGAAEYVFPMGSGGSTNRLQAGETDFKFSIDSPVPIKTVYSPTHPLKIENKTDHAISGTAEISSDNSNHDLTLVYTVSEKEIGLTVLPFRPTDSEDGYFGLFISPQIQVPEKQIQPKAVTFVIDTSGSMADDDKIEQAKKSLTYCLKQLRSQDYFNLIRFASDIDQQADLKPATPDAVKAAVEWVKTLNASGGTDIDSALQQALKSTPPAGATHTIVFITDGMPTVGETDPDAIVKNLDQHNSAQLRIFTFGVGYDVNAKLLDQIADETRASSQYVRPNEDMEVAVSSFFDKVASPILTNLELKIDGVTVKDLYPHQLPDLFAGSQVIAFGRYQTAGTARVALSGDLNGQKQQFNYTADFPAQSDKYDFVEPLWGHRKVGFLLDEIRKNGEKKELVDEVTALAKKYAIVTPYTSFLVAEDVAAGQPVPMPMPMPMPGPIYNGPQSHNGSWFGVSKAAPEAVAAPEMAPSMAPSASMANGAMLGAPSGQAGVESSIRVQEEKTKTLSSESGQVKRASNRTFAKQGDIWIDQSIEKRDTVLDVKFGGAAYFELLKLRPELTDALALGDQLEVRLSDKSVLKISPFGKEKLDDKDLNLLRSTM